MPNQAVAKIWFDWAMAIAARQEFPKVGGPNIDPKTTALVVKDT